MNTREYKFEYEEYNDSSELGEQDAGLLEQARNITSVAYAPYSNFFVGAAARLMNGAVVTGTNQENASYPVAICAERVLLANAATQYPGIALDTLAISYKSSAGSSAYPISPCGMCRQALQEYEVRVKHPIRILLSGQSGKVIVLKNVKSILPFAFSPEDLM